MTTTRRFTKGSAIEPLPFPADEARSSRTEGTDDATSPSPLSETASEAIRAMEHASRRIDDLARALNCLGFFDDDDRPRAA